MQIKIIRFNFTKKKFLLKMSTLPRLTEKELNDSTIKKIKESLLEANISVKGLNLKSEYVQKYLDSQKIIYLALEEP